MTPTDPLFPDTTHFRSRGRLGASRDGALYRARPARQRLWLQLPLRRQTDPRAGARRDGRLARYTGHGQAELGVRESRRATRDLALGGARATRRVRADEDAAARYEIGRAHV